MLSEVGSVHFAGVRGRASVGQCGTGHPPSIRAAATLSGLNRSWSSTKLQAAQTQK